jgi:hypothetical protein
MRLLEKKIRNLRSRNSKAYRKLLNFKNRSKGSPKPDDIDLFYDHLKVLNELSEPQGREEAAFNEELSTLLQNNDILDSPILLDDIEKTVRSLPNNTSPGADGILNEYIKCTSFQI